MVSALVVHAVFWPILVLLCYAGVRLIKKRRVKVNCWFCCTDVSVPIAKKNSWLCPQCEQYNGFLKNGDYNKSNPAMSVEQLNNGIASARQSTWNVATSSDAILCQSCSRNQLLKIKQLANFVPYNDANFDQEVEVYRQYLETVYQVCAVCEYQVNRAIDEKHQMLMADLPTYDQSISRSSLDLNDTEEQSVTTRCCFGTSLLRVGSGVCAGLLIALAACSRSRLDFLSTCIQLTLGFPLVADPTVYSLSIVVGGFMLMLGAILCEGRDKLVVVDVMASFAWLCCLLVQWTDNLTTNVALHNIVLVTVAVLTLCLTLVTCLVQRTFKGNRIVVRKLKRNSSASNVSDESDNDISISPHEELFGAKSAVPSMNRHSKETTINKQKPGTAIGSRINDSSRNDTVVQNNSPNKSRSEDATPDLDTCTGGVLSMKLSQQRVRQQQAKVPSAGVFHLRGSGTLSPSVTSSPRQHGVESSSRPLIAPATFCPPPSTPVAYNTLSSKWISASQSTTDFFQKSNQWAYRRQGQGAVSNVQKVFPFVTQSPQQQPQQQLQQPHNSQVQHNQPAEEKSVKVKVIEQTNHASLWSRLPWLMLVISVLVNMALLWSGVNSANAWIYVKTLVTSVVSHNMDNTHASPATTPYL